MQMLLYLRLIYLTAGTLLAFFWIVVILGHRRQRNFERIFFFLCLALLCFFGCSLLALNAQLYYGNVPHHLLLKFAWTFLCLGLWFVPAFVIHLHAEYASLRGLIGSSTNRVPQVLPLHLGFFLWVAASYLPALLLAPQLLSALRLTHNFDFDRPTHVLGLGFQIWLGFSLAIAAFWQARFAKVAPNTEQKRFHITMEVFLVSICALFLVMTTLQRFYGETAGAAISSLVLILALLPFGILLGNVQRFNFLQIGRQRNLIYAVFLTFLALLYLSLVRRASLLLDPYWPPEAISAILLFLPVAFFEPLQRVMRQLLQQAAQKEIDRAHKLIGPINENARLGDIDNLRAFIERWIAEEMQLAEVHLTLRADASTLQLLPRAPQQEVLEIRRGAEPLGTLRVKPHGAMISGETYAALELVCEQLPAAFDLCRSISEKLQLERELAERERLALVGQMAASISHNLKNPLGSIKTILQVQLESPDLPATMRHETQMVLAEISRLSAKLNQLLQFSRPGWRAATATSGCDITSVAEDVVNVFRHEAEAKGVSLEFAGREAEGPCLVAANAEAVNDIISNIVLNAIEAADPAGHVRLSLLSTDGICNLDIEDDGPGIPATLHQRIQQPFFTTKPRGTGLGLAIVQRRLEEVGGTLETRSPLHDARGTRFRVTFPLAISDRQHERPA